jgi:DNA repair protein RecO (recombination protein O)
VFAAVAEPAIVVGGADLGESDRVARLLSPRIGRFSVVARRARASRRRFAGAFEVGNEVVVDARGRGDLPPVSVVEIVRAPRRARDDLDRIALLCFGCEVAGALAPEHAAAERLFELLRHWLARLEDPTPPPHGARVAFEAKALTFAGLGPRLTTCARCGLPLADPVTWQPDGGGRHRDCGPGRPVAAALLRTIEDLRRTPLAEIRSAVDTRLLTDAIEHHLGRGLNSRGLLGTGSEPG